MEQNILENFSPDETTVVICCAGMGTRLGIGTTKALLDINGTPLIIRQLEQLKEFDDIRIVVGFQAERLIQVVKEYRRDIVFAFNYDYESTGVVDSLQKGLLASRKYVISMDGDVLTNPDDFKAFTQFRGECLAVSKITSDEPVKVHIKEGYVTLLSKDSGNMQWPGIVKIQLEKLWNDSSHVYELLNKQLPLKAFNIRSRTIDTQDDYDKAVEWFGRGQVD